MNKHKKQSAFTLVELIVVITILAILGTIAFISLQGYSVSARDSIRITDLSSIKSSLELFQLEAGKYPEPSNQTIITYSGATAWTQGTFGETVYKNVSKLDKIPKDPLIDKEYVYSTTNTRNEFQLAGAMEGDEVTLNPSQPSLKLGKEQLQVNAVEKTARLKIIGTYNGKLLKVSTGSTTYVLAVPSLITSSGITLETIIQNSYLGYNGYKNLPFQYNGSYKTDGETNLNLVNSGSLIVFTGDISLLSDSTSIGVTSRQQMLQKLQQAYTGTLIKNIGEISQILSTSSIDASATESLMTTLINNNLGGSIVSSNVTYSSCNFNGGIVTHNTSVTAYLTGSVIFGNICTSEQRYCNNGTLNGTYTNTGCTVAGATGTFNLSQTTVTQGTNVTISNTCSQAPTSYTSSNTAVATVAGTTITTLSAGTTDITPVGGACGDNVGKTLTVNSSGWMVLDPNCDIPDITKGSQVWAGCNSTLGTGFEWGKQDNGTNGTIGSCYDYNGNNTATCTIGSTAMASNTKANTWYSGTNANSDTEYNTIWGKLYTWTNSSSACPTGRHVPTDAQWEILETTLNGSNCRNATDGWLCDGLGWKLHNGKTTSNNMAQALKIPLAGYRYTDGVTFYNRGYYTILWSSTPSAGSAYYRVLYWDISTVYRISDSQALGFSVRCLKD